MQHLPKMPRELTKDQESVLNITHPIITLPPQFPPSAALVMSNRKKIPEASLPVDTEWNRGVPVARMHLPRKELNILMSSRISMSTYLFLGKENTSSSCGLHSSLGSSPGTQPIKYFIPTKFSVLPKWNLSKFLFSTLFYVLYGLLHFPW